MKLVCLILLLLLIGTVNACMGFPTIITKTNYTVIIENSYQGFNCNNIEFSPLSSFFAYRTGNEAMYLYTNESAVKNFLNFSKEPCNFTDEDIIILTNYTINGYSSIEQTDEEYKAFLDEANLANLGRPLDCLAYTSIVHEGRWTGYAKTGYHFDGLGCLVPGCGGGWVNMIGNDLFLNPIVNTPFIYYIGIAIIIIPTLIILKVKKII